VGELFWKTFVLGRIHPQGFYMPKQAETLLEPGLRSTEARLRWCQNQIGEESRLLHRLARRFKHFFNLPGRKNHSLGKVVKADQALARLIEQDQLIGRKRFDQRLGLPAGDKTVANVDHFLCALGAFNQVATEAAGLLGYRILAEQLGERVKLIDCL